MPVWMQKAMGSVLAALAIGVVAWTWTLNSRLALIENDLEKLELIQQHDASIQVIQARLGYIETGIDDIKLLIRQAQ